MAVYAGVDLGATNIRTVVGDAQATILGSDSRPTPDGPTGIAVTEAVLDSLKAACSLADVDPTSIRGVGIGSIGPLDLAEGIVDNPANLPPPIEKIPLTGPIAALVDSDRVYLHNDTNAGVIGERFHSDRNPDDMIYLTISSGIGAGITVDGHVLSGWDGNAGEVGHCIIDPAGRLTCGCGHEGHWEAYCSGNNIPRYARLLAEDFEGETCLPLESDSFVAADVFTYAGEDAFADHVIDKIAYWNVQGVTNLIHSFAPLVISIGGAVALNNEELVVDRLREDIPSKVLTNVPEIKLTPLGDDVVVYGALASAITEGTGDRSRRR